MQDDNEFDYEDEDFISKTQVKNEMLELRALGLQIAALPNSIYQSLDISAELRDAIDDYKRIKHKNALKRQASFVGKMMRREDADALHNKLAEMQEDNHRAARQLHLVEQWRDKLIADTKAFDDFLTSFPSSDRQQLRSLIRAAQKEQQSQKKGNSAKKLFKAIQQQLSAPDSDD